MENKQKAAKLVYASLRVRVIVDSNASKDSIIEAAKAKMCCVIREDLGDNIEDIVDDIECPYDPQND